MNLQQILDEIQEKYPHALTNASVCNKLNQIQKELFRTIYKPIVIDVLEIVADSQFYLLGYSNTRIIDVLVNGVEYSEANVKGVSNTNFYWFVNDTIIGLYPTPTENSENGLTIFRYKEPTELTGSDLTVIPDFDPDFHMMLVYYACKVIAENFKDFDVANGFSMQYNSLLKSFNQTRQFAVDYQIQNVYGRLV